MRYEGLIILGMVLCLAHTANSKELKAAEGIEVVMNGKVISEHTWLTEKWKDTVRTTRIIWRGRLYICEDYLVSNPKNRLNVGTGRVVARCFDDEKVSN